MISVVLLELVLHLREYGYYQNSIAEKLLLIDLSGTYDII